MNDLAPKRRFRFSLITLIIMVNVSGVALWYVSSLVRGPRYDIEGLKREAIALSLDMFFSGKRPISGTAYVESGKYVPTTRTTAGMYNVEFITEAALIRRFAGKTISPLFPRVQVYHSANDPQTDFRVGISSGGVAIKGATAIPLGGGRDYRFRVEAGDIRLVETNVETH